MRVTNAIMFSQLRSGMEQHLAGQSEAQRALSSGQSLTRSGQDPVAMAAAMRAQDRQARLEAEQRITDILEPRLAQSESVLDQLGDVLRGARDLTVRSQNAGLSQADREILAQELLQSADAVIALGNTRTPEGGWLFGGGSNVPPFVDDPINGLVFNPPLPPGLVELGSEPELPLGIDSSELLLDADGVGTLPESLRDLAAVMSFEPTTPAEQAQRDADLEQGLRDLDTVLERGVVAQAGVGFQLQSLDRLRENNSAEQLSTQQRLSVLQDTDVAEAAGQLAIESANLEAARAVFSRLQGLSLFNFLR